jgi:hypothetical protein
MALNTQISTAARNAMLDALTALLNGGGFLDMYDGSQPAGPGTAVTSQVKLAHLPLSSTAFAAASGGSATANAITSAAAIATGTAAWFRATNSGGTAIIDGTLGTSGANININSTSLVSGATVGVTGWVITEPAAGA